MSQRANTFGVKSAGAVELERPAAGFAPGAKKAEFHVDFGFTKGATSDKGDIEIRGYASTWVEDRDGEFVDPAAFDKSLESYLSKNPIILWQHDQHQPIGRMEQAEVDQYGLTAVGNIPKPAKEEPDWAHLAYNKIAKGIVKTFSIGGYFTREFVMGRPVIKEVELMEISVVSIPANPDSLFEAAMKALKGASHRPSLTQEHVKQMRQIIGLDDLTLPELVVMTADERVTRYDDLAAFYRKCGLRPPDIDEFARLRPRILNAQGQAVVGPAKELAELMRKANGGIVEEKRGRILSISNEKKLREVRERLDGAEKQIDDFAAQGKSLIAETRAELDVVLKQVEDEQEEDEIPPADGDADGDATEESTSSDEDATTTEGGSTDGETA